MIGDSESLSLSLSHSVSLSVCLLLQVALGTVTNVDEAVKWLSYTYLYVRMRANPLVYGINHKALQVSARSTQTKHNDGVLRVLL